MPKVYENILVPTRLWF